LLRRHVVNPVLEHGVGDREENGTDEDSNESEREQTADDADGNQPQRQVGALLDEPGRRKLSIGPILLFPAAGRIASSG